MGHTKKVAVVAPTQLLGGFTVLLQSGSNVRLLAYASSLETLQANLHENIPDVVLLYLSKGSRSSKSRSEPYEQIGQLKAIWPEARCIAIVEDQRQRERVQINGADIVFLKGVAPATLLANIEDYLSAIDRQVTEE